MKIDKEITIDISGLGIILYSDFAVSHINKSDDYFSSNYQSPQQVAQHVREGTIVGFSTSSSGRFILKFRNGYPEASEIESSEFKLRLAIEVRDRRICIRDLFDLMNWNSKCPDDQYIEVQNGFYHLTLCGNVPDTGLLGDDQEIYAYLKKLDGIPALKYDGVPVFCE